MQVSRNEHEKERLRVLHEQAILETPPEQAFDDLTYLAAEICGTPMALINFVDRDRQWFKSRVGVDLLECPLDFGVCPATIAHKELMVVRDALLDPRFRDNPVVHSGLHLRFYAGVPLVTADGHALGTLCVIDHVPRELEPWQVSALRLLARQVLRELEVRRARRDIDRRKMDAIDTLAGGIAHEFNNLLAIVLGYARHLESRLGPESAGRDDVRRILASSRRAAALTRQLLAFSRHQSLVPQVVDLNEVIGRQEDAWRSLCRETIRLDLERAPDLGRVKADPGQIEQALRCLVVNARDAMPGGGSLRVATRNLEVTADVLPPHDLPPGRYAEVSVRDTGLGMTQEVMDRIFDPFFTTKEAGAGSGEGSGLGLSSVCGIVAQSGGELRVDSRPGEGSTFRILLPRVVTDGH